MGHKEFGAVILGGSGYGAGELLRLLALHPAVEVASVVSSSNPGEPVAALHPHLEITGGLKADAKIPSAVWQRYKQAAIFAALPHGKSAETLRALLPTLPPHARIIDLSGDLRLSQRNVHEKFYPECPFEPSMRAQFQYGLPELYRSEIRAAKHIANPGCLASACALAVAPIAKDLSGFVVFDAKTGTSGAGRTPQPTFHHPAMHADAAAYKVLEHRHEPEILQCLGDPEARRIKSAFVPHLIPVSRGIYASVYATLQTATDTDQLLDQYRTFFASSPFVRIRSGAPHLAAVIGSNYCDISVHVRDTQVVATAALDNLVKGMAGTAVQNMNLLFGLDETAGLLQQPMGII